MSAPSSASDTPPPEPSHARPPTVTAFVGFKRVTSGSLPDVAAAVRAPGDLVVASGEGDLLVFDDDGGRVIDLDLRGPEAQVRARAEALATSLEARPSKSDVASARLQPGRRGPGRPRLGVVGKEVTLLPRHWAWLDAQKGGASATLRRLVEAARRRSDGSERVRRARDAAYRFMAALAGDLPGYEEALRALFRGDAAGFSRETEDWPEDVRAYAAALSADAFADVSACDDASGAGA